MKRGIVEQMHSKNCSGSSRCGCAWRYRIDGDEYLNGKRQQLTKGGFRIKDDAERALHEVRVKIANGEVVGTSPTVKSYLEGWLDAKEMVRKPATIAQYRNLSDRFLVVYLGGVKLADLRVAHVEAMLKAMEIEGRGLVTRRRTIAVLSSALNSAVKRKLVTWNVCTQLELPPERAERRPVWDAAEIMRFLGHVESDDLAALWRLYVISGLRRGEALALRWTDVDLVGRTLRIERTLSEIGGHLKWGTPKTASGARTIALDEQSVTLIEKHRERQEGLRVLLGETYHDTDLIFCREDGEPLWPGTITSRFHVLSSAALLPTIRLHDLRHSAASLALAAGVDLKTVSSNLGHSGISVTADLYSHVLPATARAAAEKVAEMVEPLRVVTAS